MLEFLSGIIIHLIQTSGYLGVFFLMTVESALIPFPSEVTMPFAGFLVARGELLFIPVVLTGALGNVVGSLIAYGLGYFLEETILVGLIKRYGKFILFTEHEYDRSCRWFNKHGNGIAFFSRLLPAVRTFISLPAGIFEMNIYRFALYTFFGSLLWSLLLTSIGFYLGENWGLLKRYFRQFEIVIAALLIVTALWYINHKLKLVTLSSMYKRNSQQP